MMEHKADFFSMNNFDPIITFFVSIYDVVEFRIRKFFLCYVLICSNSTEFFLKILQMNKVFAGQFVRQCKAVIDDKEILRKFQVR